MKPPRLSLKVPALLAFTALSVTSCASPGTNVQNSDVSGFTYNAPQEEVNALLEDLDPVTLRVQPYGASPEDPSASYGLRIKELIEERSAGNITVELVWGNAVATPDEIPAALADGRLDLAWTIPAYAPEEYPATDDLAAATGLLPYSPYVGELVSHAVFTELGWQNQSILDEYENQGLVPIIPFVPAPSHVAVCSDTKTTVDDWQGAQIRVGSTAHNAIMQELGASPVSIDFSETYEALQRGTVDCNLMSSANSADGNLEVAPNISFMTETSFPNTGHGYVAGRKFAEIPLPYQQVIYDSVWLAAAEWLETATRGVSMVEAAKEHGGEIQMLPNELQDVVAKTIEDLVEDATSNGYLDENTPEQINESAERWTEAFDAMGYTDHGDLTDYEDWYDESTDYDEIARFIYENGPGLEQRPN